MWKPCQIQPVRHFELDVLVALRHPFNGLVRDAVLVLENSPAPIRCRQLKRFDADASVDQVDRLGDALARIDKDKSVAEPTVQENGKTGEGTPLIACCNIGRSGCLGDVELPVAKEPPMTSRGIHLGQYGEIDSVWFNGSLLERPDDLVVAAGKSERKFFCHVMIPLPKVAAA
jgi:hypothetical protein